MTTCSAHAQIPAGKPAAVSVNGVAIAARRDRARNAASSGGKADRGLAAGRARARHSRTAAAAGSHDRPCARTDQRRGRTARDRRRGVDARASSTAKSACPSRTTKPAGAITTATARVSARPTSTRPRISCSRRCPRTKRRMRRRATMRPRCWPSCASTRNGLPSSRRRIRAVRRRRRVAISGRSPRDRPRPNSSRRSWRSRPVEMCAAAGRDALRLSYHPARSQARGPGAALRTGRRPHRRLSARKRAAAG